MATRVSILAVIVSVALIGCASPVGRPFSGVTKDCDSASCPIIEVSVVGIPPQLIASIDTLRMKHDNNDANIIWKLKTTQGYEFGADSISFKDPRRAATQFSLVSQTKDTFHMKDKNKDDVYAYGYQIKVYETASGIWIPLDPWVVNN